MKTTAWVEYRYRLEDYLLLQQRKKDDAKAERWANWAPDGLVVIEEVEFGTEFEYEAAKLGKQHMGCVLFKHTYEKAQYAYHVYVRFDDGSLYVWKAPREEEHLTKVDLT